MEVTTGWRKEEAAQATKTRGGEVQRATEEEWSSGRWNGYRTRHEEKNTGQQLLEVEKAVGGWKRRKRKRTMMGTDICGEEWCCGGTAPMWGLLPQTHRANTNLWVWQATDPFPA